MLKENKVLIGFSGKIASGKDYTSQKALDLVNNSSSNEYRIFSYSFASALREEIFNIASMLKDNRPISEIAARTGETEAVIEEFSSIMYEDEIFVGTLDTKRRSSAVRRLLQFWGTDVRRASNPDYWVNLVEEELFRQRDAYDIFVITDVRFPNEANMIKRLNGLLIRCTVDEDVRIKRIKERGTSVEKEQVNHESELALDDYTEFDLVVDTDAEHAVEIVADFIERELTE